MEHLFSTSYGSEEKLNDEATVDTLASKIEEIHSLTPGAVAKAKGTQEAGENGGGERGNHVSCF